MGYLMVHLKIAQELLKGCDFIKDKGAFYKGSIAPDAIMFREGCKRQDKSLTHFCTGDEGWGYYTNYEEWKNNLFCSINKYKGYVNDDFIFGYSSHILTDIECARQFWNPVRLTNDENYKDTYIKDCGEVDSRLMENIENMEEVWSLLSDSHNYCLDDLFSIDDTKKLIHIMINDMYARRHPNFSYYPTIFTVNRATKFIEEISTQIIVDYNKIIGGM
jgi:hypothetical protein